MKTISLSKGMKAIVDDEDYERVIALGNWHICAGYASRYTPGSIKTRKRFYMHHLILELEPNLLTVIDHINRNRLDNRKSNLRLASRSLNGANSKAHGHNKTGYRGVTFYPHHTNPAKQWRAVFAGKHIGYFASPEEASKAYQQYISMIK